MKLKKRAIPIIAGTLAAVMLTSTASAHIGDILGGIYIGQNGVNRRLIITSSAYTELFNLADVYSYGESWNNISSKARVTVLVESQGMPAFDNATRVVGSWNLGETAGETRFYDKNGKLVGINSDCAFSMITMNTNPNAYTVVGKKIVWARKAFIHEVGHVLKMDHPEQNLLFEGHETLAYGGFPYAVMNQRSPSNSHPYVSPTITEHDISCLIAKWGA